MNLYLILYLVGMLRSLLNKINIILALISIEIMLLSVTFLILVSLNFDDILGGTSATHIITIPSLELGIGLGILVAYYGLRGSTQIKFK